MFLAILILALGFAALLVGAEFFVSGAAGIARRYRVSELVIGLTVVSMGTSAPELIVNVFAALEGRTGLVFGNIVGSNNVNLLVILGLTGLISPLVVQRPTVWKEIPYSGFALLLVAFLVYDGGSSQPVFSRMDGLVCMLGFGLFLLYAWRNMRDEGEVTSLHSEVTEEDSWMLRLAHVVPVAFRNGFLLVSGLALLVVGGRLVVDQAVVIALELGMTERIIGLTIVAIGTSLPELATSVVAGFRGKADIAVGNVIGSNIFNLLLVLGMTGLIAPVPYDTDFNREMLLLGAGTLAVFFMMFTGRRHRLDRWEAGLLLGGYIAFTALVTLRV
jgi:cation:H+ antiporter